MFTVADKILRDRISHITYQCPTRWKFTVKNVTLPRYLWLTDAGMEKYICIISGALINAKGSKAFNLHLLT